MPETAKIKSNFAVLEGVVKKFFEEMSLPKKFVDTCITSLQTTVLLRSALNKLEKLGDNPAARLKADKGGVLVGTTGEKWWTSLGR